jgi:hypothetical protein
MSPAKLMLSPKELELVNDPGWILTKNAIIEKVYALFGGLNESYGKILGSNDLMAKDNGGFRSPKITKGEQYENLPWVMLDHPRCFDGENVLAIRSFFWWGNFCSITLLLSGSYRKKYEAAVQQYFSGKRIDSKDDGDWFICVNEDPWQHHFRKNNYQPITEWGNQDFAGLPFIKLGKKISLQEWDNLNHFFEENYTEILKMLTAG